MTRSDDGSVTLAIQKINPAAASRPTDARAEHDHCAPVISSIFLSVFRSPYAIIGIRNDQCRVFYE
jgi:hypothetical protein